MWRWRRVAVARVFAGLLWFWDILFGYKFIALAKTVTPGGSPRREPGQAVAPNTEPSSLVTQLSRHGKPMTYTDLLCGRALFDL